MILLRLKSSIPAGFYKFNHHWSLVEKKTVFLVIIIFSHMDKEVHEAFYGKYNRIFRACATRPLLGGGAGNEAKCPVVESVSCGRQPCMGDKQTSALSSEFCAVQVLRKGTEEPVCFTE